MGLMQLSRHYGFSDNVIRRMVRETKVKLAKVLPSGRPSLSKTGMPARAKIPSMDGSEVGQAANYLRKFYANVHSAAITLYGSEMPGKSKITWGDARDLPDHGKGFYFVAGPGILKHREVIKLAYKHGWQPFGI
jgi:hypothetical protein